MQHLVLPNRIIYLCSLWNALFCTAVRLTCDFSVLKHESCICCAFSLNSPNVTQLPSTVELCHIFHQIRRTAKPLTDNTTMSFARDVCAFTLPLHTGNPNAARFSLVATVVMVCTGTANDTAVGTPPCYLEALNTDCLTAILRGSNPLPDLGAFIRASPTVLQCFLSAKFLILRGPTSWATNLTRPSETPSSCHSPTT